MSLLDTKIFGLIRTVADSVNTYTARQRLQFTGTVVVTDDPATNTTTIDVSGGGGGGTPSNVTPAGIEPIGDAGVASAYSRGDHTHALTPANLQSIAASASTDWDFNGQELKFLGEPVLPGSAARLQDVDAGVRAVSLHPPVVAVDIGFGVSKFGTQTIDGRVCTPGERVGMVGESSAVDNGIYVVSAGAWQRAADWNTGRDIAGDFFYALEGTDLAGTWFAAQGPSAIVGTDPVTMGDLDRAKAHYGDVTGLYYTTRVEKIRGAAATNRALVEARSVMHADTSAATLSRVYHHTQATATTTPATGETHTFSFSAGAITAVVQVDFMNSSGVVESFHLRQTRSYDSIGAPVLIGTAEELLKPAVPTALATLTWGTTGVSVTLVAPSAIDSRWGVNLHVFEVASP